MPTAQTPDSGSPVPGVQGRHYEHIKAAIPQSLIRATPALRASVRQVKPAIPDWYAAAAPAQKIQLQTLLDASIRSHAALAQSMDKVQDVNDFARPLLTAALTAAGFPLDVDQTCLRLYVPTEDTFGVGSGGFKTKTFSLLQAALNNFEAPETRAGFFDSASGFITAPDANGHFERFNTTLKIEVFATLCRELDLGQQYQTHLTTFLRPTETVAQNLLRERYITRRKDAFKAAACLALLKHDIGQDDYALLLRVASGERKIMLGDKQIWYRRPCMMHLHLQGCLIIDPCVYQRYSSWFIAYIPDDPEHPIKRYESFDQFEQELTRRLTAWPTSGTARPAMVEPTEHQQFFARFVARKDLAHYYRRFTEAVQDAPPSSWWKTWLRSEQGKFWVELLAPKLRPFASLQGDPRHRVRVALEGPNLDINADSIKGAWVDVDLWAEDYEAAIQRLFDDGMTLAVPTAQADAANRSRRLAHYLNIGLFALNLAAMAVPPLGTVMAVAMAAQLMYEVLEGAIELSEGDREAGWAHIGDVLENLAMLAAGGAVYHFTVSPFIDSLKAVTLPSGEARLWKPDLKAYQSTVSLPSGSTPNALGLHRVQGQEVLALEGKRFALKAEPYPGKYRIHHPLRPEAYQPEARHNGSGAWSLEDEQPLSWHGPKLMRRLGHVVDGLDDQQLEAVRRVSDVDESVLRRLHVESEPTPALLLDTVRQFQAYGEATQLSEQIFLGQLSADMASYAASLMVELPYWPAGRAIEVFEGVGERRVAIKYGDTGTQSRDLIRISHIELMRGKLPERVVAVLSEDQLKAMLGQSLPKEPRLRSQQLQARLGAYAQKHQVRVFRSRYSDRVVPASVEVQVVQRAFTGLPTIVVQELLSDASKAELQALTQHRKISLRLSVKARRLQATQRLAHAYEGLYLEALADADTEALVLNTLETLPGWKDNLRIEVRDGSYGGELRASYGPHNAATLKVLVRVSSGSYQAFNGHGLQLHGVDTLYASLQHALTDSHRQALGLPHVGQGLQLKLKILQHALPRERLREVLHMTPSRIPFFKPPQLLPDGRLGYPLSGRGLGAVSWRIETRIRELYPSITPQEIEWLLEANSGVDFAWLTTLEREYSELFNTLQGWLSTPIQGFGEFGSEPHRQQLLSRRKLFTALTDAWRRVGPRDVNPDNGQYYGEAIELDHIDLSQQLASLPELTANFDHVSRVGLSECGLTDSVEGFLRHFHGLRSLNLELNRLTRLPQALEHMHGLEVLRLPANRVVLDLVAVARLKKMTRLLLLDLDGNPLGLSPDISRMGRLWLLYLNNTGLPGWPTGIFAKPRPRGFRLDLNGNPITQLPDVAPGSERAQILVRTGLDRSLLPPDVLEKLKLYIESVGLDPDRRFPPRGTKDSVDWKSGLSEAQWSARQPVWDALEESLGSEPFFNEIRNLRHSGDAAMGFKADLTAKVWRMLSAMYNDLDLRDKLFSMAAAPTTCVDAGAQLFNAMGVEVLLSEAYSASRPELMQLELLSLAIGKSRLDELGRIAHARVGELVALGRKFPQYDAEGHQVQWRDAAGNPVRAIDEVEIHLAYVTHLRDRLELPWQSHSMRFLEPDVTAPMVEAAYLRVLALEQGDLLRDGIVQIEFWTAYLQSAKPEAFVGLNGKIEALNSLQEAMSRWVDNDNLSIQDKAGLTQTIDASVRVLGKPQGQFSAGREMTDDEYTGIFIELRDELSTIFKTLTDQMLVSRRSSRLIATGTSVKALIQPAENLIMLPRQGRHSSELPDLSLSNQEFVKKALPAWLIKASAQRPIEITLDDLSQQSWFQGLSPQEQQTLKRYTRASLQSQQVVSEHMASLQTVEVFGKALLTHALKEQFKVEPNVDSTFIKLNKSLKLGVLGANAGTFNVLNVSLLHAALHNFEAGEGEADFFDPSSEFATRDGASISLSLTVEQFITLCRSLDIGAQYQTYLNRFLKPQDAAVDTYLRQITTASQKDAMRAAAYLALVRKDIEPDDYAMVLKVIDGERNPTLGGKPVWFCALSVMGFKLKGCVVFESVQKYRYGDVSIVYVPHDPEHPFKRYNHFDDLKKELTRQLLAVDATPASSATGPKPTRYQRFFSQFVDGDKRPYYFSRFTEVVSDSGANLRAVARSPVFQSVFDVANPLMSILLKPQELPPEKPAPRETAQAPELKPMVVARYGLWSPNVDLWADLYESNRDKIIADARHQAVPTADVDAKVRARKIAHLWEGGFAVAGLVSMFVPVLGEVMMAVMVEQLLAEIFEGVMDWSLGDREAARQHLLDVAQNLALMALMAGAGKGLAHLPKVETPALIDQLKPVRLPGGEQRLWKPDLVPYRTEVSLPVESQPNDLGLHRHNGRDILPLDGGHYAVEQDLASGEFQIPHPTRPDGYAVALEHNGTGIWTHGADEPLTWDGPTLMKRLGYRAQGLDDAQLERVRVASGVEVDDLRRMYVEQDQPSALLGDTLSRFRIEHDLEVFARQIASERPQDFAKADLRLQFKIMREQGLLPAKPLLRVVLRGLDDVWEDPAPVAGTASRQVIVVDEPTRTNGSLLESLLTMYKVQGVDLSAVPGTSQMSVAKRAGALRKEIAADAQSNRLMLFESLYKQHNSGADPLVGRIQANYPHLPDAVVEQLLEQATKTELEALANPGALPPRIDSLAKWCQQELRVNRAYEGLHLDISTSVDSERLALHSLEILPGWPANVRFELREGGARGRLLDTVGEPSSPLRGVLVVNEGSGFALDGTGSLYASVLSDLLPQERQALGYTRREAERLKQSVLQAPMPREAFSAVLHEQRVLKPSLEPGSRLLGGMPLSQQMAGLFRTSRGRVRKLFPGFTELQADAFLQNLGDTAGTELTRLEAEFAALKRGLNDWAKRMDSHSGNKRGGTAQRDLLPQRLIRAWQRQGDTTLTLKMGTELPPLKVPFPYIEELVLEESSFNVSADAFLNGFSGLKRLRIKDQRMSEIPQSIGRMQQLTHLDLSGCMIEANEAHALLLEGLTQLQDLNLQGQNMSRGLPDFSRMPRLRRINLRGTYTRQWPPGLRDQADLQRVDLRDNSLREVPAAVLNPAPEHLEAQAKANRVTLLQDNRFTRDVHLQVKAYRERLAGTRPELLAGGLENAFTVADPLATRLLELYPNWDEAQVEAFVQPLETAEARTLARAQEHETLQRQLSSWAFSGGGATQSYVRFNRLAQAAATRDDRYLAMERIKRCWRQETEQKLANDGTPIGLELDLSGLTLESLPDLDADFSHVGSLKLSGMNLSRSPDGFLNRYRGVRWLDMSDNQLTRLPQALGDMHGLTRLFLNQNRIRLDVDSARMLSERTTLRALRLQDNPLGVAPDFTRITDMRTLSMSNTELETWPVGLSEQPLVDTIDLRRNRITTIPDNVVAPSAEHLEQMSRLNGATMIQGNPLSEATQQRLSDYWSRLERERPDLVPSRYESAFRYRAPAAPVSESEGMRLARDQLQRWTRDLPLDRQGEREAQWFQLAGHPQAAGFFEVLRDLEASGAGYTDLQQRIWTVIDTITEGGPASEALREQMFEWAGRAACCDRAALSFSNLEIMSLVYRAETQAASGQQAASLLKLARGLFRLDHVDRLALREIDRRTAAIEHSPELTSWEKAIRIEHLEEVEIRLAYRYGLKDRLNLPAQPSQARFIQLADVTPQMLDQVYTGIVSMDNSLPEFHALLARDFWKDYVTNTYRPQFEAQREPFQARQAALHERHLAGEISDDAYTRQSDVLAGELQIAEAKLIETLSRTLVADNPL
ncbi:DUF6543 domain-containing protein [uncultured Pseudomonas sp.]|uniref:NEL-type E3 ubiquitin ligase domain-containing protein n=1 Tax=uncultured Pseudomonas sp. TaxID=114707 RepID=UPI0025F525F2|nr:DUF6543 domain-containing protein [uncultured Pseudomonas sp.]